MTQKIALITGAGSGIGRASAIALAKAGFGVVLAGRRRETLEETAVHTPPKRTLILPTDVTQPEAVQQLFDQTETTFGRLDILFNNAGIVAPPVPLDELRYEKLRAVIDTNLTAVFLCTQHALRLMKQQTPMGGRIINNGSTSAQTPRPNSAPYTATKHAITGLTKSTILDGRPFNITASQIDIGNAATPMTDVMSQGVPQADGSIKPEPTFDVQHVADTIVHIANLPLDVNIPFITLKATTMPLEGRG